MNDLFLRKKFIGEIRQRRALDENFSIGTEGRAQLIEPKSYYINLIAISIILTAVLFSLTMLMFLIKRLEGNIFLNFYLDGAAGIVGTLIGQPIYGCLKIRYSLLLSLAIVVIASVFLYLFHDGYYSAEWSEKFGQPASPFPPGSE